MSTNYERGYNFERQVKLKLEAKGFYVMRSAGSHTVIDLIAFKEDEMLLIQLKSSSTQKEPDVKQLLKSYRPVTEKDIEKDVPIFIIENQDVVKTNVKLLEELKVPLVCEESLLLPPEPLPSRKIILFKGTGRNNIWQFEYLRDKWYHVVNNMILKEN